MTEPMKTATILLILFAHWIADFVLQTDEMAKGKSTSNKWLSIHVGTYTATLGLLSIFILPVWIGLTWSIINGSIHWVQDYWTSRINSKLLQQGKRHLYFVSIGADQFLHYSFLILSLNLIDSL